MNFNKQWTRVLIISGCILFLESSLRAEESSSSSDHQDSLSKLLIEKEHKLALHKQETERIFAALLRFSKPSVRKALLFSSPQDYTRISVLLESLSKKAQESLLDLQQEIAELDSVTALNQAQEKKIVP